MVRSFLQEGAHVHFCSRTQSDIDAANAQLASDFPKAKASGSAVDVADQEALGKWVHACAEQNRGKIDVVIANVSALGIEDSAENWRKTFDIDLLGLHTLSSTAYPYLERTKGNLITISSVSGRDIDFTAPSPYGPAKAAVIHYTASLARKWAPQGVRANSVSPGNIYIEDGVWGGVEKGMPELFESQWGKNPMGRMGRPEEVADAVLFVASARAGFVSGSNLTVSRLVDAAARLVLQLDRNAKLTNGVCFPQVDGALCNGVQF